MSIWGELIRGCNESSADLWNDAFEKFQEACGDNNKENEKENRMDKLGECILERMNKIFKEDDLPDFDSYELTINQTKELVDLVFEHNRLISSMREKLKDLSDNCSKTLKEVSGVADPKQFNRCSDGIKELYPAIESSDLDDEEMDMIRTLGAARSVGFVYAKRKLVYAITMEEARMVYVKKRYNETSIYLKQLKDKFKLIKKTPKKKAAPKKKPAKKK